MGQGNHRTDAADEKRRWKTAHSKRSALFHALRALPAGSQFYAAQGRRNPDTARASAFPNPPDFGFENPKLPSQSSAVPDHVRIKDLPPSERPRERLLERGAAALGTDELLAILLRTGTAGISALDAAQRLVKQFGTLHRLAAARPDELSAVRGVGRDKAVTLAAAFELAQRLARELHGDAPLLDTPERVADFLRDETRLQHVERLQALFLNTRRRLIGRQAIADGTLDSVLVHPREVFKAAITANAAAVLLAHNHPSGDPTPSEADIKVTRDLIRAGQLLRIEVLDHVILGHRSIERERDYVSLREMGYFYS